MNQQPTNHSTADNKKPTILRFRLFRWRLLRSNLVRWLIYSTLAITAFSLGIVTVVALEVWYGDHSKLEKNTILALIEEESTIYYLNEKTQIGSLFDQNHRRYEPITNIPAHMQNAIIASEDKNFYFHYGIDVAAISKALMHGITRGFRFRRGGSTITQQTVKNIMQDWEPTFARKFREMIKAFQLEKLYNKKQILEFYLNQFHVSGNGSGISIAAKYYFNKAVMDLNLIEAAFIAGSLKSPSKYNPFIKRTKEGYNKAIKEAFRRKNYVLTRMYEQKWITKDEYKSAKLAEIPFEKGTFSTSDVTLLRLIKQQLAQPEILDAVGISHPNELHTAGLRVYTTIDQNLQKTAQRVTRRNLARLETILSGHKREDSEKFQELKRVAVGDFAFAKITDITIKDPQEFSLKLSMGLPTAVIPYNSLKRYAKLLNLAEAHAEGYSFHLKKMKEQMQVGDIVFMEIKKYDNNLHSAVGEIYRHPTISGGSIVLDKGEVRAVISGFHTQGFHRAIQAKRQPGSVFKIPTMLAALQLGWTILDRVHNQRQVFSYQGKKYYPRPDHPIKFPNPSLLWSGVMSENLGFVYLAYHLLDKINIDQFKKLLEYLNLQPRPKESPANYHYRISKKIGVGINTRGIKKQMLGDIVSELKTDLIFSENTDLSDTLSKLWWGDGYIEEIQKLYREDLTKYSKTELQKRIALTRNNFVRYQRLKSQFFLDWQKIKTASKNHSLENLMSLPEYQEIIEKFSITQNNDTSIVNYHPIFSEEEFLKEDNEPYIQELHEHLKRQITLKKIAREGKPPPDDPVAQEALLTEEKERIISEWPNVEFPTTKTEDSSTRSLSETDLYEILENPQRDTTYFVENIYLDGKIPFHMMDYIEKTIPKRVAIVKNNTEKYALNQYFHHHDFRIALGLYYLAQLSKILGAESYVSPVLSTPLGTNVLSVADIAKIFQTFAQGNIYRFFENHPAQNQLSFIKRIESRNGEILYTPSVQVTPVIDPLIVNQLNQVMRKVMTHGTGRRAHGELYIDLAKDQKASLGRYKIRIPSFGKTGTTNDFTTSYFAGFVPYPKSKGENLSLDNFYTLATYVGYDTPQQMRKGRISIYGGTGALPLWTDFFKETIHTQGFESYLDAFDIDMIAKQEWSRKIDENQWENIRVDLPRGLVLGKFSEPYIEDYKPTNLSETGEEFQDIHRISRSVTRGVKGEILVPKPFDEKEPIPRVFAPLSQKTLDDMGFHYQKPTTENNAP